MSRELLATARSRRPGPGGPNGEKPPAGLMSLNIGPSRIGQSVMGGGPPSAAQPYASLSGAKGASVIGAAANLITSIIGVGVTTMAPVFENIGYIGSLFLLILATIVSQGASNFNAYSVDLSGGAEDTIALGTAAMGIVGGLVASISSTAYLCGSIAAFIDFGPYLMRTAYAAYLQIQVTDLEPDFFLHPDHKILAIAYFTIAVGIPSCLLKDMTMIAKTSIIALGAMVVFFGSAFIGLFVGGEGTFMFPLAAYPPESETGVPPGTPDAYQYYPVTLINWSFWGAIAAVIKFGFGYAVAVLVPTIKKDMANPSQITQAIGLSHLVVVIFYYGLSSFTLYRVGGGVKCAMFVMDVLPYVYQTCGNVGVLVNVFLTVPLLLNPVFQQFERLSGISMLTGAVELVARTIFRAFILFLIFLFSAYSPGIDYIIGLVSAFAISTICVLLPSVFYLVLAKKNEVSVPASNMVLICISMAWFIILFVFGGYKATYGFAKYFLPWYFDPDTSGQLGCYPDRSTCPPGFCTDF